MSEFRRDPILGQWTIVHTGDNSWAPEKYQEEDHAYRKQATCPFCPGKEHQTPPEIDAIRPDDSSQWDVRVVPNKFPALMIEGDIDLTKNSIFEQSNGVGAHEVVVDTPAHDKDLADFKPNELQNVLLEYQRRVVDLGKDGRFKYIAVFRNFGVSAGASMEHPHSQIIALPMVPSYVQNEIDGARRHYNEYKTCIFCDIIQQEVDDKERIIHESDEFIAFCPFVSRYPFETWLISKAHDKQFIQLDKDELLAMANALGAVLTKIKNCLKNPSYNFYLHIDPVGSKNSESFHWHIEIIPKLTQFSGFEWGTGFYVVRTDPSHAAKYLREA